MMVDIAIFSRRLDALEDYLQRLRSLGRATESEYVADPDIRTGPASATCSCTNT